MTDLELLLIGYALGAVPTYKAMQIVVAAAAKKLGVKPSDIEQYDDATEDGE